jgi:hypothetical protein
MGMGSCAAIERVAPIVQNKAQGEASPVVIGKSPLWALGCAAQPRASYRAKSGSPIAWRFETGSKVVAENPKIGLCYHPWRAA